MSYRGEPIITDTTMEVGTGMPTYSRIRELVQNMIKSSHFEYHETEAFEVKKISKDVYGGVLGKFIVEPDQPIKGDVVLPLMPHITNIPVIGEHVVVVEYNAQHYYTCIINRKNSNNENSIPGAAGGYVENTKYGETFQKKDIRRVEVCEGEIVYEGRFGNSIKLGCDHDTNSPIIKIRAGQANLNADVKDNLNLPTKESIDNDHSSIYLTSDGVSDIKFDGQTIGGKKILIKSDGIFIKGNDIRLGGVIKGDLQPVVRGNDLKELLDVVFEGTISTNEQAIKTNTVEIVVKTNAGDVKGAAELTQTNIELQQQNTKLTDAINNSSYLSNKVKTV
jgi:hypothetical protein